MRVKENVSESPKRRAFLSVKSTIIDSNNFEKILAYGVLLMYNNRACLMR